MARGRINHERWIQHYFNFWMPRLRLKSWKVTWEVADVLRDKHGKEITADCETYFGSKRAHIRFNRRRLRTKRKIEIAVNHELLHLYGKGARGRDEDIIFNRLDQVFPHIRLSFVRINVS